MYLDPTLPSLRSMAGQFYSRAPARTNTGANCVRRLKKHPSTSRIHMRSRTGKKRKSILIALRGKPVTSPNGNFQLAFAWEKEGY
jgi:hypothetical protein